MKVLVVGNVFKDVYLNIDERAENFETDEDGVKWLDIGFNTSEHRFFSRTSTLGGALITLEILGRMKQDVSFVKKEIRFTEEEGIEFEKTSETDLYRYILVANEQTAYFAPSFEKATKFEAPGGPVDCIFVDRSANLKSSRPILDYLEANPTTKLIVHLKKTPVTEALAELAKRADLIFVEDRALEFKHSNIVYLGKNAIKYRGITQSFETPRADLMTHLSVYSILAATILGGMLLGLPAEKCLKFAKTNVENSNLDACLSLERLEELSA